MTTTYLAVYEFRNGRHDGYATSVPSTFRDLPPCEHRVGYMGFRTHAEAIAAVLLHNAMPCDGFCAPFLAARQSRRTASRRG